jgi:hypothetical protein
VGPFPRTGRTRPNPFFYLREADRLVVNLLEGSSMPEGGARAHLLSGGGQPLFVEPVPTSDQPIGFGGEDEVAFGKAIDLVSPDGQPDLPPGQIDVGVVPLLLSEVPDPISEVECCAKILETKLLLEVVIFHNPPVVAQSSQQVVKLRSPQGRRSTFTWNALKHGQVAHSGPSSAALGPGVKGGCAAYR